MEDVKTAGNLNKKCNLNFKKPLKSMIKKI